MALTAVRNGRGEMVYLKLMARGECSNLLDLLVDYPLCRNLVPLCNDLYRERRGFPNWIWHSPKSLDSISHYGALAPTEAKSSCG